LRNWVPATRGWLVPRPRPPKSSEEPGPLAYRHIEATMCASPSRRHRPPTNEAPMSCLTLFPVSASQDLLLSPPPLVLSILSFLPQTLFFSCPQKLRLLVGPFPISSFPKLCKWRSVCCPRVPICFVPSPSFSWAESYAALFARSFKKMTSRTPPQPQGPCPDI